MNREQTDRQEQDRNRRTAAEVTVTAVCAIIVLFMVGYSIYHGIAAAGTPPRLSARPLFGQVEKRGGSYILPVEVYNRTRPTAEDVEVTVRYTASDGEVFERNFRIEYLPEHSKQTGYVALPEDPEEGVVRVEIESYKLP